MIRDMLIAMRTRNAAFIAVFILGLVDVVIPIPILGLLLIWVIVSRPPWFRKTVDIVYGSSTS